MVTILPAPQSSQEVNRTFSRPPGVVTRPGYLQLLAHESHRKHTLSSPVRDRSKLHCWSLANQVATFFAKATCIFSWEFSDLASLFSSRSRSSSARSGSINQASAGRSDSLASRSFFTHFPNVISCTPILRATSAVVLPSSRTNATALALYSSVNRRRVEPIPLPPKPQEAKPPVYQTGNGPVAAVNSIA